MLSSCLRHMTVGKLGTGTVDFICSYLTVLNFNLLIYLLFHMLCVYFAFYISMKWSIIFSFII